MSKTGDKIKRMWEKLKSVRHIEIIIAVIAVAIMLFVYFGSSASCSAVSETGINGAADEYDYCTKVTGELESKLSEIEGVGDATVLVNWESGVTDDDTGFPKAEGVIIICDGGNDISVKLKLISSVAAYFGIDEDSINVLAKGN